MSGAISNATPWIIGGVVTVIVILIIAGIVWYYRSNSGGTTGPTGPTGGTIKPRPTNIQDCGYIDKPRGWADIQGQGVPNDYCRMVGADANNPYFSCYLAGSTSQFNHDATKPPNNPNPLPALSPLVRGDTCFSDRPGAWHP